jgi:hypothetical protein
MSRAHLVQRAIRMREECGGHPGILNRGRCPIPRTVTVP